MTRRRCDAHDTRIHCALLAAGAAHRRLQAEPRADEEVIVTLPDAHSRSTMTLDEALTSRRSIREFTSEPIDAELVGHLLWAAQGITSPEGGRTAPSAGALYPLELYAVTSAGIFHYRTVSHDLATLARRDVRADLSRAALGQGAVRDAALVIVVTADYSRTATKYGVVRGERYVLLEAGHAAQNVLLEAAALGLGAVPIGAFDDGAVARVLALPAAHAPIYLIALGRT
jgi:SagB-type dehydrogenase family enzyme